MLFLNLFQFIVPVLAKFAHDMIAIFVVRVDFVNFWLISCCIFLFAYEERMELRICMLAFLFCWFGAVKEKDGEVWI